jgi:nucleoside 2-deoxyribosyltransferase
MGVLEAFGHEVTSTWLRQADDDTNDSAVMDLHDVTRAEALVLLNPREFQHSGTGGRHVEFGYALALGKPLVIVGMRSNVFHQLNHVVRVHADREILNALDLAAVLVRDMIARR